MNTTREGTIIIAIPLDPFNLSLFILGKIEKNNLSKPRICQLEMLKYSHPNVHALKPRKFVEQVQSKCAVHKRGAPEDARSAWHRGVRPNCTRVMTAVVSCARRRTHTLTQHIPYTRGPRCRISDA